MRLHRIIYIMLVVCGACLSARDTWNHGAFFIPELSDDLELRALRQGQALRNLEYVPGLIRLEGDSREDVFLFGSNRMACFYTAPGQLTVERFEQLGGRTVGAEQKSRLILHVTEGVLTADTSSLSEDSQCIVETPLGRLNAGAGRWTLSVRYDARTRIYNFTLESIDLELFFKTHSGQRFVVQAGQMLTGAGASTLPDLEVADLLNSAQERIQILERMTEESLPNMSTDLIDAQLLPIAERAVAGPDAEVIMGDTFDGELDRPIVIEYSPRPQPAVPFRGVVRPPREYEKDMF